MERITFNSSLATSVLHAWATEFNRAHRQAPISASMWRLRFAAAVTFVTLVFLAGRALAETNADAPTGKPDAVIDLATREGVDLVKGQWRYSDTKIIPVDFKAAGPDKQPTGKPIKTYNFLIVEALERYHLFYGDSFKVECPTGSGNMMTLQEISRELARRLGSIFLPNEKGARPCHGDMARYSDDPHWRDLVLFYEYFHGETGRGCGASHQTGWTALAVKLLENTIPADTAVAPEALWSATRRRVALTDVTLATP
jgi:hypothetical protein